MIFYGRTFIQRGCLERGDLKGVPQRDFRPANLLFKVFWPVFPFGHGPFWVWSLLGIVPFGHGPFWVRSLLGMVPFGYGPFWGQVPFGWSLLAGPFWPVPYGLVPYDFQRIWEEVKYWKCNTLFLLLHYLYIFQFFIVLGYFNINLCYLCQMPFFNQFLITQ